MAIKIRTVALAAAVLAASGVFALTTPASASAGGALRDYNACDRGAACLWTVDHYRGDRWQYPNSEPKLNRTFYNTASSARNNGTKCEMRVWSGESYTGDMLPLPLNTHRDNLLLDRRGNGNWDNIIKSVNWKCPPVR